MSKLACTGRRSLGLIRFLISAVKPVFFSALFDFDSTESDGR